jgi:hypothetical protein
MDSNLIDLIERQLVEKVDKLFKYHHRDSYVFNDAVMAHDPIWGLLYPVDDEKTVAILKARTRRALAAQAWFQLTGPAWAQPLPLSYEDRQQLLVKEDSNRMELFWHYAESLAHTLWDYRTHPPFQKFGQGVMAHPAAPDHLREDPELLQEFPPAPLVGLSEELGWYSPEMLAEEARLQELMWGAGHEVREV